MSDEAEDEARSVDIVIEDDRWEDAGLPALAERAARATLDFLNRPGATLVVLGCDDERIAGLNADFRGKPKATNVLSWPAVEHAAAGHVLDDRFLSLDFLPFTDAARLRPLVIGRSQRIDEQDAGGPDLLEAWRRAVHV